MDEGNLAKNVSEANLNGGIFVGSNRYNTFSDGLAGGSLNDFGTRNLN